MLQKRGAMMRGVAVVLGLMMLGAAPRSDLTLRVDLSERILDVRVKGDSIQTYPVGIGTKTHPTPTGTFTIRRLVWNPKWVPPRARWALRKRATPPGHPNNPMKVVKIFFKVPDYYIHGTGEELTVGEEGSHGCLRMTPADVRELGELVMKHGGQPRAASWYATVLRGKREAKVRLRNPITIQITK